MKNYPVIGRTFFHAAGVVAYILLVALLLSHAKGIFGDTNEKSLLIPVFMLLLFIISALMTGSLVLGKPVLLYLDGQRKEAFVFLGSTTAWLIFFFVIVFVALLFS